MSALPRAEPLADADVPLVPPALARAPPLAEPLAFIPPLPDPPDIPDVVFVFCEADVLWFVVPLGAIVTLLCGIALKFAFVFTFVVALGATPWPAVVLVLLLPRPEPDVPEVVFVFCDAAVLWFVVPLGAIVTVLCGIALNFASVLTLVVALGATAWPAVVLVLLLVFCAMTAPLSAASTAAAMTVNWFRIIRSLLTWC